MIEFGMKIITVLVLLSYFIVESAPQVKEGDTSLYEQFLVIFPKIESCKNYNVSLIRNELKDICSSTSIPEIKKYASDSSMVIKSLTYDFNHLVCYSVFHNVYALCNFVTAEQSEENVIVSTKSKDNFCLGKFPQSLSEKCSHWLPDPEETSEDDCNLVNRVIGSVFNGSEICERSCIVPDFKSSTSSINPLCDHLWKSSEKLSKFEPKKEETELDETETLKVDDPKKEDSPLKPPGLATVTEQKGQKKEKNLKSSSHTALTSQSNVTRNKIELLSTPNRLSEDDNEASDQDDHEDQNGDSIISKQNSGEDDKNYLLTSSSPAQDSLSTTNSLDKRKDNKMDRNTTKGIKHGNSLLETTVALDYTKNVTTKHSDNTDDIHDITEKNKDDKKEEDVLAAVNNTNDSSGSFMSTSLYESSSVNNQNVQDNSKKEDNGDDENTEQTESKGNIVPESLISSDEKNESKNELNSESQVIENKYESQLNPGPEINEQSSFFGYFILFSIVAIIAYLVFHNKQKILALILEGRRSQGNRRRSGGREYRKLDSNLEDAMDSGKEASLRQVIY